MSNSSPHESAPQEPGGSAPQDPAAADTFGATLRAMWATRPPRIPSSQGSSARLAGVCEGIGARYRVDPTFIRIIFVVTTLMMGTGVAAYLLAWMCMPRYGKASAPIDDLLGRRDGPENEAGLAIGLIFFFLAVAGMGPLIGEGFSLSPLLATALWLGGWYLLHQRQPHPPAGLLAAPAQSAQSAQSADAPSNSDDLDFSAFTPVPGYPFPPGRQAPPQWDPLGVAPDLWDLPDTGGVDSAASDKLDGAASGKAGSTAGAGPGASASKARGKKSGSRASGIIAIALTVIALTVFVGVAGPENKGIGEIVEAPENAAALRSEYALNTGSIELDLSKLNNAEELRALAAQRGTPGQPVAIDISVNVGSVELTLPRELPYRLECTTRIGSRNCGEGGSITSSAAEPLLDINVRTKIGSIEVKRP
ncbi:PspC domain-containing protein [Corynebacterium lizhenjunii]|uniref:PspC domain-containing protein n=1 Tax=Corynebacterium lizhenjunii TaxID=2709394 RepID=A0A7T0KFF9_9CORY|nr:PspC domain-containing protein [Corynebacterium lizhenjunii]QPK79627.1 PspC domain-containing protein [Corynebacterium lizhenjunii]